MDYRYYEDVERVELDLNIKTGKDTYLWDPQSYVKSGDHDEELEFYGWTAPDRVTPVVVVPFLPDLDDEAPFSETRQRWIAFRPELHRIEEADYKHWYHEILNMWFTTSWSSYLGELDLSPEEIRDAVVSNKAA